jgi:hypothetical protein
LKGIPNIEHNTLPSLDMRRKFIYFTTWGYCTYWN